MIYFVRSLFLLRCLFLAITLISLLPIHATLPLVSLLSLPILNAPYITSATYDGVDVTLALQRLVNASGGLINLPSNSVKSLLNSYGANITSTTGSFSFSFITPSGQTITSTTTETNGLHYDPKITGMQSLYAMYGDLTTPTNTGRWKDVSSMLNSHITSTGTNTGSKIANSISMFPITFPDPVPGVYKFFSFSIYYNNTITQVNGDYSTGAFYDPTYPVQAYYAFYGDLNQTSNVYAWIDVSSSLRRHIQTNNGVINIPGGQMSLIGTTSGILTSADPAFGIGKILRMTLIKNNTFINFPDIAEWDGITYTT